MSKKEKTTSTLPAVKNLTMEHVPLLLEKIRQEIKSLKSRETDGPIASGDIPGIGNVDSINDVVQLIAAKCSIRKSAEAFEAELKILNKDKRFSLAPLPKSYKIGKYGVDAWLNKIDSRIIEITQKDKIEKLKEMEKQFAQFESEEQKLQSAFATMSDLLSS